MTTRRGMKRLDKEMNSAPTKPPEQMEVCNDDSGDDEVFPEEEGGIRVGDIYIPPAPPAACSVETKGPRLVITKIEAENFKSYAGKQSLGPFHKSFTSIIGPNGSGKSNVIDSMLFVFGYRASKIRSKKISVLLHKSPDHQHVSSCTVAVSFCQIIDKPNDVIEEVPNSHFVIARTAFPDNSSYYLLNGRRVQFKEVATRLREHGIDLVHNRFLILQGEVEQIAMMKPKGPSEHESGMLEYLEDIIGTSRFKVPIDQLALKVEELTQERSEKLTRVKLAEKERDALEGPMKEAVEFLQAENKVIHNKNKLLQKYIHTAQKTMEQKMDEKKEIDDSMKQLKEELKRYQDERADKEKEVEKLRNELNEMINKKDKLNDQFKKVSSKDTTMAEEIVQTNKNRKKMLESKKQEEHKLTELKNVPDKNRKDIDELKKLQEKLKIEHSKEEAEVNKVLASLQEETVGLQDEKEKHQTVLSSLKEVVADAKSKHDLAQSDLDVYLSNEQKEKAKLEQLKTTLNNITNILEKRKVDLQELSVKLPEEKQRLKEAEQEIIRIRQEEKVAAQTVQKHRLSMDEVRNSMQANKSRNQVLDYLMNKKQIGELPGIFGRLGDLGAIDEKYDVAVSTACSPLDNIVVDVVETGKCCVEALKRDNVGRATFIGLDKQQHLRGKYSEPFHAPENVPRLFDLIKVADDRVRPAFYYALRNTLVAENLEQASRIAYGSVRHRVVTLDGEIIEPSGTMSGGGRRKLRGRIGCSVANLTDVSVTPGEMQKKEKLVQDLEGKLQRLRDRANALENTIVTCKRNIENWTMEAKKCRVQLQSLAEQEPQLQEQVSSQETTVKAAEPDKARVKEMEALIKSSRKELDKAEQAAGVVEAKINELHKKIIDATGGRMKAAQRKLEDVNKKLDKITSELSKLTVGIKTAERNAKKSAEEIQNLITEIEEAEQNLRKMNLDKGELANEAAKLLEMVESISNGIEEKEDEKRTLIKSLGNISKEENKLKAQKLMEDQKIDGLEDEIKEQKDKIPRIKQEMKKLKLHKIPNESEPEVLDELTEEQLLSIDSQNLAFKIATLEDNLSKKKPNLTVIDEYNKKVEQYNEKIKELDEVTARRNECRDWHDTARKSRLTEFMAGFTIITLKLKEMYQMITLGGDAELELVDSLDPFSEGIIFSVRPPKKSWKNISNLSGGEKTLSSLALVFALHYYKPTPLYVMDEIDAALDFKNVSIVGHYIKERTKNAQFIIISLRANMFELADRLIGIYKVNNCTKSVTINPGLYCLPPYYHGPVTQSNDAPSNGTTAASATVDTSFNDNVVPTKTLVNPVMQNDVQLTKTESQICNGLSNAVDDDEYNQPSKIRRMSPD
ncbi:structural maintenance of chromosomes 4-like protein gluon [Lycorma delicatula]|uniref:structural maintenance of chromosomes 4-like protein gluon n=1 Tax=Lycorma delicatula TaxID=130591 RepID=UPI003F518B52